MLRPDPPLPIGVILVVGDWPAPNDPPPPDPCAEAPVLLVLLPPALPKPPKDASPPPPVPAFAVAPPPQPPIRPSVSPGWAPPPPPIAVNVSNVVVPPIPPREPLVFAGHVPPVPITTGYVPGVKTLPLVTSNSRRSPIPKTGTIVSAKFNWYITGGSNTQLYTVEFNNRTSVVRTIVTTTLQLGPSFSGSTKIFVVSGLNIPVTENDEVSTIITCPTIVGTPVSGITLSVDYIIQ
jgi:hypothetical protein